MTCSNKDCVKHTEKSHVQGCITSGVGACKDWIHNHQCWTKEDMELLRKVLSNYENR